ncbi:GerAB/ArcD/ProY family transporter, partial [Alicyclobacillus sp.]|uniref:GerAB/ArcD/ProY family transporter n=1 Tax=Alicyclobacillus sp. TaxID=61169 RepID=UPI0025C000AD
MPRAPWAMRNRRSQTEERAEPEYRMHWLQIMELVSSSYLPLTFWFFPRLAVQAAGIDAPWAVVGTILMGVLIALLHGWLCHLTRGISGADMAALAFGRWPGKMVNALYTVTYFGFTGLSVFYFVTLLRPFYTNTPRWALIAALMLVAWYGASCGVETIARVATVIHLLAGAMILIASGITMAESDWYWRPTRPVHAAAIFHGTYELLPLYLGFSLYLMLNPYFDHVRHRTILYPLASVAEASLAVAVAFVAVAARFGLAGTQLLTDPISAMIQMIRLEGWLIERVGIFAILVTVAFTVLFTSNHLWALSALIARTLDRPETDFGRFVAPVTAVVAAVAILMPNELVAEA